VRRTVLAGGILQPGLSGSLRPPQARPGQLCESGCSVRFPNEFKGWSGPATTMDPNAVSSRQRCYRVWLGPQLPGCEPTSSQSRNCRIARNCPELPVDFPTHFWSTGFGGMRAKVHGLVGGRLPVLRRPISNCTHDRSKTGVTPAQAAAIQPGNLCHARHQRGGIRAYAKRPMILPCAWSWTLATMTL
jgi:hypothetical protein